jgi:hypothetical protein
MYHLFCRVDVPSAGMRGACRIRENDSAGKSQPQPPSAPTALENALKIRLYKTPKIILNQRQKPSEVLLDDITKAITIVIYGAAYARA